MGTAGIRLRMSFSKKEIWRVHKKLLKWPSIMYLLVNEERQKQSEFAISICAASVSGK